VFFPTTDSLEVVACAGMTQLKGKSTPLAASHAAWVAKEGETLVVPNIAKSFDSWEKRLFMAAGYRAHIFAPVDWAGKRLAVLAVHSRNERLWATLDISLFQMFIGLVAVALENARLYEETEDKAHALQTLNGHLEAALRIKTRFLSTVSHELRSPLFVVMGYSQLIADGTFGEIGSEISSAAQKINKQGMRLSTMIAKLLDISQLESGRVMLAPWPFDLREVLDQAAETVPALIEAKPIAFECDYDYEFPLIVSDREKLKQTLGHLLDNAAKFTESGKIILRAHKGQGGIEITVEDTGVGIDPAHQEIIFDGFRQVDDEDNRRHDGMGLGLYLSQQWLKRLGASIRVESELGAGARFLVWLPHRELAEIETNLQA
jgi:signal transduction histidine kinase